VSFRFRRTLSLLPGVRLNLGKTGASVSIGPKGAKLTVGSKGVRATASIPGTGMSFSQQIAGIRPKEPEETKQPQLSLPPEVEEVIRERPPHWEFLLIQKALRSAVGDIEGMAATASSHGTDAITFHEWIAKIPRKFEEITAQCTELIKVEMLEAFGPLGKPGDAERLVNAVDQFISLTRIAIVYQQRAAALARHPLYGSLAEPFRDIAQPFVNAFKDLLQRLDDQLPNVDVTHHVDLQLKLDAPPSLASFGAAQDAYGQRFFDSKYALKTGDVVAEQFRIARGSNELGIFRRAAIADNLANNIFQKDDRYWSDDAKAWQPLSDLLL
jgi:hypothetical protein